ncbi:hypothetical protein [Lewinella sp. W8]|uniref:hypothetical protein n=1 Tax=Lewinella sp. W8 TaxID=2528208 RepID=UPI00106876D7|nr:hypothetical protein [Lewinella sp. W8]MTB53030.1 hypothetical protein [Lewinella sp. W8]
MDYLLFLSGKEFDQGSLGDHLRYLKNIGGTPDFWRGANEGQLHLLKEDGKRFAEANIQGVTITNEDFEVVWTYEPKAYVDYLSKDHDFREVRKYFGSLEEGEAWAKDNLSNYNMDMVKIMP